MVKKICTECQFNTFSLVEVNIRKWRYCPVCGSHLTNSDDMGKIDINNTGEKSEDKRDMSDIEEILEEKEKQDFVDGELEKLRKKYKDDDKDN